MKSYKKTRFKEVTLPHQLTYVQELHAPPHLYRCERPPPAPFTRALILICFGTFPPTPMTPEICDSDP